MTNHSTKHPIITNTHSTKSGQKSGRNHYKRGSSSHNSTVWSIYAAKKTQFRPVPSGYLPDSIHILRCTNAVQSKKNANGIGTFVRLVLRELSFDIYSVRASLSCIRDRRMGANTKMPRKSPRAFRSGGFRAAVTFVRFVVSDYNILTQCYRVRTSNHTHTHQAIIDDPHKGGFRSVFCSICFGFSLAFCYPISFCCCCSYCGCVFVVCGWNIPCKYTLAQKYDESMSIFAVWDTHFQFGRNFLRLLGCVRCVCVVVVVVYSLLSFVYRGVRTMHIHKDHVILPCSSSLLLKAICWRIFRDSISIPTPDPGDQLRITFNGIVGKCVEFKRNCLEFYVTTV